MLKNKIVEIAREIVEKHCNSEGFLEMYYDYRDEANVDDIEEAVRNYAAHGYTTAKDYFEVLVLENCDNCDSELYDAFRKAVMNTGDGELIEMYNEYPAYELLEEAGYNGIDPNVDSLLRNTEVCINLSIATEHERNSDMTALVTAFGSYRLPSAEEYMKEDIDNALSWLIKQQGHSIEELYDCLFANPSGWGLNAELGFIESIVDEIVNNSSEAMSEVVFLIKLNGSNVFDFFETIKTEKAVCIKKDVTAGIYNEWSGCGGVLGINLEKDVILPTALIREAAFEDGSGSSISSVYGLMDDAWTESFCAIDDNNEELTSLCDEDIRKAFDALVKNDNEDE